MRQVFLDKEVLKALDEAYKQVDDRLDELEEIHEEMNRRADDIERRLQRLVSRRA
jgi:prefoldin subunit 5